MTQYGSNYGYPVHLRVPDSGNELACGAAHIRGLTDRFKAICCRLDPQQVTCPACQAAHKRSVTAQSGALDFKIYARVMQSIVDWDKARRPAGAR